MENIWWPLYGHFTLWCTGTRAPLTSNNFFSSLRAKFTTANSILFSFQDSLAILSRLESTKIVFCRGGIYDAASDPWSIAGYAVSIPLIHSSWPQANLRPRMREPIGHGVLGMEIPSRVHERSPGRGSGDWGEAEEFW